MNERYEVRRFIPKEKVEIEVPGSKSITNRALMLAALSNGVCKLTGVLFSDDSRAFLSCLIELGFEVNIEEELKTVAIRGLGGAIPNRNAEINVRSAGTAARFLTAMLAFAGGDYLLQSSDQMKKRPMEPLITLLRRIGVSVNCIEEEGHFPFEIHSKGIDVKEITMDTSLSSQFVSALLMAGIMLPQGLKLRLSGSRTAGAYIKLTLSLMQQFGIEVRREGDVCYVPYNLSYQVPSYQIEPDVSGACYFYAVALLLGTSVVVKGVHLDSMQGDIKFLEVLKQLECSIEDTEQGICVTGRKDRVFPGIRVNMNDFSDQTMTLAVLAPFAASPTMITNISHIQLQESNRISAIIKELTRLGIRCEEKKEYQGICIYPGKVTPAIVETYEDHRMAMAFTLIGLRVDGIIIDNPGCCAKTFENYFDIIDELTAKRQNG
ncbi:3-phosphoshikimate 1-carboxyvinyltransferase [Anaerocolumna xylanovorans]|uniref:3-phosphoshikimate 1-carboxyvinyltransferase n=1 Tax=Anaerocolumna xylanovorans DSM 12503 TaxID=1121345 RepID=A0A1M7Y5D5_9FIRM|nr:3-phosphoshikimate 1-carboxyvinyltransferase [Anaerocolumna xylanovorans]SHO47674.1 3-phosphoshikimate 1-carboxyvinyltransferase [Anaerocolumna xylanovorans DSM 12503]